MGNTLSTLDGQDALPGDGGGAAQRGAPGSKAGAGGGAAPPPPLPGWSDGAAHRDQGGRRVGPSAGAAAYVAGPLAAAGAGSGAPPDLGDAGAGDDVPALLAGADDDEADEAAAHGVRGAGRAARAPPLSAAARRAGATPAPPRSARPARARAPAAAAGLPLTFPVDTAGAAAGAPPGAQAGRLLLQPGGGGGGPAGAPGGARRRRAGGPGSAAAAARGLLTGCAAVVSGAAHAMLAGDAVATASDGSGTDFVAVLQGSGDAAELPLALPPAAVAAGVSVVVSAAEVRLLPAAAGPAAAAGAPGAAGLAPAGERGGAPAAAAALPARALGALGAPPPRQLEAVLLSHSPRLLVVDGFFEPGLCRGLMALAEGRLVRSRVASGSETPSRTSWSHFFVKEAARHELVAAAEARVEALFGCAALRGPHPPLAKVEAMQVVKYHEGEFYHEHYDNRAGARPARRRQAPDSAAQRSAAQRGARSAHAPLARRRRRAITGPARRGDEPEPGDEPCGEPAGRGALPPCVSLGPGGRGVKVFPVQGRAVVFWCGGHAARRAAPRRAAPRRARERAPPVRRSKRPDGSEDPNSIHAADTVLRGAKYIATRWMKDGRQ
ncbi:hypothetical protein HT031_006441 [Scenedesmus sp. PABB004]|nr:hypothetical protein HT031_006441 [Scenedesmus sp. PABB004]